LKRGLKKYRKKAKQHRLNSTGQSLIYGTNQTEGNITLPSPSQQRGEEDSKSDEAEGGIFLTKDDIRLIYRLIYKALRYYNNPTEKEAQLHGILVEEFEELLATEYIELKLGEE